MWDVIKVEAIISSMWKPSKKLDAYAVVKENLNILSVLMNYKHLHLFHAKNYYISVLFWQPVHNYLGMFH
jgi:ribosomal protein S7